MDPKTKKAEAVTVLGDLSKSGTTWLTYYHTGMFHPLKLSGCWDISWDVNSHSWASLALGYVSSSWPVRPPCHCGLFGTHETLSAVQMQTRIQVYLMCSTHSCLILKWARQEQSASTSLKSLPQSSHGCWAVLWWAHFRISKQSICAHFSFPQVNVSPLCTV